jgi:hypothetical protein
LLYSPGWPETPYPPALASECWDYRYVSLGQAFVSHSDLVLRSCSINGNEQLFLCLIDFLTFFIQEEPVTCFVTLIYWLACLFLIDPQVVFI